MSTPTQNSTTPTTTTRGEAPQTIVKPNGTRITISTAKPAPRRQKRVQKPIVVEPKQPATIFELRLGRLSFVLSAVVHPKKATA